MTINEVRNPWKYKSCFSVRVDKNDKSVFVHKHFSLCECLKNWLAFLVGIKKKRSGRRKRHEDENYDELEVTASMHGRFSLP